MVGKPPPVPEPGWEALEDLGRLKAWGCLQDGDALSIYLGELERYRCSILAMRDEEDPDCD